MAKVLLWRIGFQVATPGPFNYNLQFMPHGYRIFGAFGWSFSSAGSEDPVINLVQNGPSGTRGTDSPKYEQDKTLFSGTINVPGTFTLLIPLVPYEDIEFNY